jgi:hypothetical protein
MTISRYIKNSLKIALREREIEEAFVKGVLKITHNAVPKFDRADKFIQGGYIIYLSDRVPSKAPERSVVNSKLL